MEMELNFRVALIVGVLLYLGVIFYLLKKRRLGVQYAIIWLLSGAVLLLFALFPYIVLVMGDILKVLNPVNFVFLVILAFVLLILLSLSAVVSGFSVKIKSLTQNAALLERRIRELEAQLADTKKEDDDPQDKTVC
ncbi:MAG: DUF2304 domain-containing protein [Pygmaiobacter sp.]|jgi:hypothetical protein|nr:DUF2304 domain-containing protein [Pygmaiobacter sp.]